MQNSTGKYNYVTDSYVFGVGVNVPQEDVNDWVTKRAYEKYLYLLPNMKNVPETLDKMIGTSIVLGFNL